MRLAVLAAAVVCAAAQNASAGGDPPPGGGVCIEATWQPTALCRSFDQNKTVIRTCSSDAVKGEGTLLSFLTYAQGVTRFQCRQILDARCRAVGTTPKANACDHAESEGGFCGFLLKDLLWLSFGGLGGQECEEDRDCRSLGVERRGVWEDEGLMRASYRFCDDVDMDLLNVFMTLRSHDRKRKILMGGKGGRPVAQRRGGRPVAQRRGGAGAP